VRGTIYVTVYSLTFQSVIILDR